MALEATDQRALADPRLHVMMFLESGVKALWLPMASVFLTVSVANGGLGFNESQKGLIIAIPLALGAICAPLMGQIADRWFPAQKLLAILLLAAGVIKFVTAYQTTFMAWLVLSLFFAILYVPTVPLTNSIAMTHLRDPKRQFPFVRVWGTWGWIAMSWIFPMIWLQTQLRFQWLPPFLKGSEVPNVTHRMIDGLKAAGIVAVAYAVFCWVLLPHTPPRPASAAKLALGKALRLTRYRSFSVLLIVAFLVSILHTIYFVQMGAFLATRGLEKSQIMQALSLGQIAEIATLGGLGFLLRRFGFHRVMTLGAFCFFLRYALIGIPSIPLWGCIAVQLLHGFCFGCFFAAGFIYVDRIAPKDVQHSAQTLFIFVMMGAAPAFTGWFNGYLASFFVSGNGKLDATGFSGFWQVTAVIGLAATMIFALLFTDQTGEARNHIKENG